MPIRTSAGVVPGATVAAVPQLAVDVEELQAGGAPSGPTAITFHTAGATFAPVLTLSTAATVLWTLPGGATSASLTPTVSWGTPAARTVTLTVTPWSALQRLNLGYDAGDGGSQLIELVASCDVTAIEGLELVKDTLAQLCVSNNVRLTRLDLTDFRALDTIECYYCSTLQHVRLANTNALKRLCFENNDLREFDISACTAAEDVRGALNAYNGATFGGIGAEVWHICLQTNAIHAPMPPMTQFPKLRELFLWSCQQTGKLDLATTRTDSVLSSVLVYGNHYTSADFTGRFLSGQPAGMIDLGDNDLTALTLTGCMTINNLNANNNNLDAAAVDGILAQLVASGVRNGTVNLTLNAGPTEVGVGHIATLRGRGWTCSTEADTITLVSIAVTPAAGSVTAGTAEQYTATGTYDDESTADVTSLATWTSSDGAHATVSSGGLVTGVTESTAGEVTITATIGAVHGDTTLTVAADPRTLVSIAVTPAAGSVTAGATQQYTATGTYDDASTSVITSTVTWDSSDDTHATISVGGLVTGVAESTAGEVTITATLGAIEGTTTLTVDAPIPATITWTTEGDSCHPTCVAAGATVTWTLEDLGAVTGADPGNQSFGTAAPRTHTLTMEPASALTQLRNHDLWTWTGATSWSGLGTFPNLAFFCEEGNTTLTSVDFTDCASLRTVHLANCTGMTALAMDTCFTTLDAAVGASTGQVFYYPPGRYTAASAAARASLVTKGWTITEF